MNKDLLIKEEIESYKKQFTFKCDCYDWHCEMKDIESFLESSLSKIYDAGRKSEMTDEEIAKENQMKVYDEDFSRG